MFLTFSNLTHFLQRENENKNKTQGQILSFNIKRCEYEMGMWERRVVDCEEYRH